MRIILARHGNTFNAGEPAYYVGSAHDLPLVDFGNKQAQRIGTVLANVYPDLAAVYTGPLLRMTSTARRALDIMKSPLQGVIDERLNELDYGLWSGLTAEEVRHTFGEAEYERWEQQSQWPLLGQWGESQDLVIARIQAFVADLLRCHGDKDDLLVVASNGCLRYFLTLVPGAFERQIASRQLKIGTGHLCQLSYCNGSWTLDFWNQSPELI